MDFIRKFWKEGLVEVAGVEPAYSLVNSKPCRVWCPYRCPSVQIKVVTYSSNSGSSFILRRAWKNKFIRSNDRLRQADFLYF